MFQQIWIEEIRVEYDKGRPEVRESQEVCCEMS